MPSTTYIGSRYGYDSVTELTEVPCGYENVVAATRVLSHGRTERTAGYGYECRTQLTEVLHRVLIPGGKPGCGSSRSLQKRCCKVCIPIRVLQSSTKCRSPQKKQESWQALHFWLWERVILTLWLQYETTPEFRMHPLYQTGFFRINTLFLSSFVPCTVQVKGPKSKFVVT